MFKKRTFRGNKSGGYSGKPSGSGERREGGSYRPNGGSGERREGGYRGGSSSSGGFNRGPRKEGGFERREGGFNGPRREGGFERREGGFNGPRPAGRAPQGTSYNRDGFRREGGYRGGERREGGYRGPRREGGFERREGGYRGGERRDEGFRGGDRREGGFAERRRSFMDKAKEGVQDAYKRPESSLIQAVRAIDDLDNVKSLMYQRLSEWAQLNFPELDLKNEETVCALYSQYGDRKHFPEEELAKYIGAEKAKALLAKSFGAPFDEKDRAAIKRLASEIVAMTETRTLLEDYAKGKAQAEMPNLCYLIEPMLAARLLSLSGNLERFARLPSSTVQVMGAEKALFKHLKNKRISPPKHGIIFQDPMINTAPLSKRGKIARALAGELSIAVKADFYTKNFIAPKLKEDLEGRLAQIRELKEE
ncbi:putative NOP5 family protein [Candidatus Norongarragalina meridionalis]|nr:putative NOP5 family protein [Candidatus Norongarragalina meridionalis]